MPASPVDGPQTLSKIKPDLKEISQTGQERPQTDALRPFAPQPAMTKRHYALPGGRQERLNLFHGYNYLSPKQISNTIHSFAYINSIKSHFPINLLPFSVLVQNLIIRRLQPRFNGSILV